MADSIEVGVLMGSKSDWDTMKHCADKLEEFGVGHEVTVLSGHRTPGQVFEYGQTARQRGLKVIIAAAGGAAHLAGMLAANTSLPVLGVPMMGWATDGMDSLLATVQMPKGIPVGTLAVGKAGAINSALLAIAILANNDPALLEKLEKFRADQTNEVLAIGDPRK